MSFSQTPGRKKRVHAARKPTRTPKTHESTLAERVKRRRRGFEAVDVACKTLDFNTPVKPRTKRGWSRTSDASDDSDVENSSSISPHGQLVRESTPRKMTLASDELTSLVVDVERLSIQRGNKTRGRSAGSVETSKLPKTTVSLAPPNNRGRKKCLRISRSQKNFDANHELEGPLGNQENYGGGCLVYCSRWQQYPTVTKLMPLFAENGFDEDENVENAHRETDIHTSAYRMALKTCPLDECPVVPIWAVTQTEFESKPYLALVMPRFNCNLAEYLHRTGPVQPSVAWRLLKMGVEFIRICLECNFVHHDIKPENIFLTTEGDQYAGPIRDICFGDFGCGAWKDEEFPFNPITGTVTMWDRESLGRAHGNEDGFCFENDIYGMLGCVFDAVVGYSLLEDKLDEVDPDWESYDWAEYTNLVRHWRPIVMTEEILNEEIDRSYCSRDDDLRTVLLQLTRPRRKRMDLEQILRIVEANTTQ